MSHFTVLVVGENPEEQLLPFLETSQAEDGFKQEWLEFDDVEEGELKTYNTKKTDEWYAFDSRDIDLEQYNYVKKSKGEIALKLCKGITLLKKDTKATLTYTYKNKNDKYVYKNIYVYVSEAKRISNDSLNQFVTVKKISPPKKVSFKDKYKTFEEYMLDYCGHPERDPQKNRYGYWHNSNAKWDWYELGGRWCGFFKLSAVNVYGKIGNHGHFGKPAEKGYVDQTLKGNIDFKGMVLEKTKKAEEDWIKIQELLKENKTTDAYFEYGWEKDETKESYIKRNSSTHTFAVIKDGKFYERGKMGWWGVISDSKEYDKWIEEFDKLIDGLSDDTLLSVYDCHI